MPKSMKALQITDVRSRLAQQGTEPLGSTPEEYAAYIKSESTRWGKMKGQQDEVGGYRCTTFCSAKADPADQALSDGPHQDDDQN